MKIAVLGAGKMGRWLIRELASKHEVWVHDLDEARLEGLGRAKAARTIDELTGAGPEMLINAVSLKQTVPAFEAVVPGLRPDCLLADVVAIIGSVDIVLGEVDR